MKNRKRYGRKIKRTRTNLYRKRKTRGQKILGTVLLVFAVAAAGFLGYCVGKPLLEFIDKNAEREEPEWTPPAITTEAPAATETEETHVFTTTSPSAAEKAPEADEKIMAVTAASTALQNRTSLHAFIARAKAMGCNTIVLPLKDEKGYFHYASPAAMSRGETLVQSILTADEIAEIFRDESMRVIGTVSVLSDNAGCELSSGMCYKIVNEGNTSWLDFDYDPPIFWADPSKEATLSYFGEIMQELNDAEIDTILTGLVFPSLEEHDRKYLASQYFEETRSAMLLPFARENTSVEMLAEDMIDESIGRTAELLREKDFYGGENTIAVRIRRESFPTENGWPSDADGLIEDILEQVRAKTKGLAIIPVIEQSGFSAAEMKEIKTLLDDTGYIID